MDASAGAAEGDAGMSDKKYCPMTLREKGMSGATTKMSDFELLVLANKRIAELEAKLDKIYRSLEDECYATRLAELEYEDARKWARRWKRVAKFWHRYAVYNYKMMPDDKWCGVAKLKGDTNNAETNMHI